MFIYKNNAYIVECIGSPSGLVPACALGVREFDSQQTQKNFKNFATVAGLRSGFFNGSGFKFDVQPAPLQ